MSEILTKADILKGVRSSESVEIEGLGTILLRPLTDGEHAQAEIVYSQAINAEIIPLTDKFREKVKGTKKQGSDIQLKLDMGKLMQAETDRNNYVAACGLSVDEQWNIEEVKSLKPGIPKKVAEEVYRITNVTSEVANMIKSFRTK